ncbi:MAG: patatin, partial [Spirochaetota bacterium]
MQTIDIMELTNTQAMLAYTKPTVLIEPNLLHLGSLEFNRAQEAIAEGKRSCEAVHSQLEKKVKLWV